MLAGASLAAYADTAGTGVIRRYVRELFGVQWDLDEIGWFASCLRAPHVDTADARRALSTVRSYVDVAHRWPALA